MAADDDDDDDVTLKIRKKRKRHRNEIEQKRVISKSRFPRDWGGFTRGL